MSKQIEVKLGDKFNRWTTISEVFYKTFPGGASAKFIQCRCDCGTTSELRLAALTSPSRPSISCGCYQREMTLLKNTLVLDQGEVFGRLTVDKNLGVMPDGRNRCIVSCSCGSEPFPVRVSALRDKKNPTRSCGCLQREKVSKNSTTHGMTKTSAYNSWQGMKDRCTNENNNRWDRYGGRGISYPLSWNTFDGFWLDMSEGWYEGSDIDRIDFNLSYSKDNCRWADRDVGNHNKGKSKGTSQYKGVYYDKARDKWTARCNRNGVIYLQKRYETELEAAIAYDNCSEEIYGDRPNHTTRDQLP